MPSKFLSLNPNASNNNREKRVENETEGDRKKTRRNRNRSIKVFDPKAVACGERVQGPSTLYDHSELMKSLLDPSTENKQVR